MTEHVKPAFGWMMVTDVDWPFAKPKGIIIDPMLEKTNLRWFRVIASGSTKFNPKDLICVREGCIDKLFADGGVCFGLVHDAQVNASVDGENASHVRDKIRTPDMEIERVEKLKAEASAKRIAVPPALSLQEVGTG